LCVCDLLIVAGRVSAHEWCKSRPEDHSLVQLEARKVQMSTDFLSAASEKSPFSWLRQEREEDGVVGKWTPFRRNDSIRLEEAIAAKASGTVAVEGGRYDVDLERRTLRAVYWEEPDRRVLRSSWFYGKGGDRQPYEEEDSQELELAFQRLLAGKARLPLLVPVNRGQNDVRFEALVKEAPAAAENSGGVFSYFGGGSGSSTTTSGKKHAVTKSPESEHPGGEQQEYSAVQESVDRSGAQPNVPVFRGYDSDPAGYDEQDEEEVLPARVECLVFVVHGIGQYHRAQGGSSAGFHKDVGRVRQLAIKHLRNRIENGLPVPGRIEFLPLEWYESIHVEHGIGNRLKNATLPSVPALRDFANFAIADILVYQDDEWRQRIHGQLHKKMARLWKLFRSRTADYSGETAVIGHSLGSVIMFDLLQKILCQLSQGLFLAPSATSESTDAPSVPSVIPRRLTTPALTRAANAAAAAAAEEESVSDERAPDGPSVFPKRLTRMQPPLPEDDDMKCPVPRCLFAIGSPLGMFLSIRLSQKKQRALRYFEGLDVRWPASSVARGWRFFNVFHPDDPIAYRIEPLLNSNYVEMPPRTVPHLGGLRWNNQVREGWQAVRSWTSRLSGFGESAMEEEGSSDQAVSDVLLVQTDEETSTANFLHDGPSRTQGGTAAVDRIDYALQESAFESMNEFLSAISSHFAYWDCEDLVHFIIDQTLESLSPNFSDRGVAGVK